MAVYCVEKRIAHQKFLEVQKPFFKKVFGRRRQSPRQGRRRQSNFIVVERVGKKDNPVIKYSLIEKFNRRYENVINSGSDI